MAFRPGISRAQEGGKNYEILPAPDFWYNDVDGIRAGLRLRGQVPGTFEDGPHRLDFGIWLGTWLPDLPVSYYLSFTEPIPSLSAFNSEASLQLKSSVRTGWQEHALGFNKRWQTGFNERNYREFSFFLRARNRFDREYVPYAQLWNEQWIGLADLGFDLYRENKPGYFSFNTRLMHNFDVDAPAFTRLTGSVKQRFNLGGQFNFKARLFAGVASDKTAPQYRFSHSISSPVDWMGSGFTRGKGTIPVPWMDRGLVQVSGGANLRGYVKQDIDSFKTPGSAALYTSIGSFNAELAYPNPINSAFGKIPVLGGFLKLKSYTFFDAGTSLGLTDVEDKRTLADAGLGFALSLNIPDYLGKPRGFVLRYDIPLWLSHPQDDPRFKFRNIIGIGAVIAL